MDLFLNLFFWPVGAVNPHTRNECLKITKDFFLKCEYIGRI